MWPNLLPDDYDTLLVDVGIYFVRKSEGNIWHFKKFNFQRENSDC